MLSLATLEMGMVGPKKAGLYIINSQRLGYASLTPSTCQGYLALDGQTGPVIFWAPWVAGQQDLDVYHKSFC
jgi:hypothetical protein